MMYTPLTNIILKLATIAIIHTFVLGWMVWDRVSLLRDGQEVMLSVEPVDPRDLLRGDYVILRYTISRINLKDVEVDGEFQRRDPIYVGLKKTGEGPWKAISINHQRPQIKSEIVFLKGKVKYVSKVKNISTQIRIKYGIEKYFIPEGEGPRLEALRNDKVLSIVAAVSNSGESGIKALLIRGEPVYEEPVF